MNTCSRMDAPGYRNTFEMCASERSGDSPKKARGSWKENLLLMLQPAVSVTTCIRSTRAKNVTSKLFESVIVWDRNIRLVYNQIFISQTCLSCVHSGELILPK